MSDQKLFTIADVMFTHRTLSFMDGFWLNDTWIAFYYAYRYARLRMYS